MTFDPTHSLRFARLATISAVRLISLQINDGSEQLENLPPDMNVERLGPDFDTGEHGFIDAAAVLEVVDLIVSCDTSIVHLCRCTRPSSLDCIKKNS